MPWSNQNGGGGGPWGGGGKNGGPWGQGPQNSGPNPPDLEEMIRKGQERLKQAFPGGGGSGGGSIGAKGIGLLAVGAIAIWMATGFYTVKQEELGVELLLGTPIGVSSPGLNYNLPYPIGMVDKVNVTQIRDISIGSREFTSQRGLRTQDVPEESLMLTGDENIIDIDFSVFWVINNAQDYLFNIQNPVGTVKAVAESSMREVVGQSNIQPLLTEGRQQAEARVQDLMQNLLDEYGAGIRITQVQIQDSNPPAAVIDAFRDVQAARADAERSRNEAESYANRVLPQARGESERIEQEAAAYRDQTVEEAEGQARRFLSIYGEYAQAPDVTRQRMYLETMERVLGNMNKVLIDGDSGSGVVPYLPLPEVERRRNTQQEAN